MKWFKHDSDANQDAKLKRLRMKYGMEGYGLYWYCLELIAKDIEANKLTCDLEHDAELISFDTGIHYEKVEDMMNYMVKIGLFEDSSGIITCMKLIKRIDQSMSSSKDFRDKVKLAKDKSEILSINHDDVMTSHDDVMTSHDDVMTSHDDVMKNHAKVNKNKVNKTKEDNNGTNVPCRAEPDGTNENSYPYSEIVDYLNQKTGKNYKAKAKKTQQLIKARYEDGHTLEEFKKAIDNKVIEWRDKPEWSMYLRPETLFGPKMEGYCNQDSSEELEQYKNMSKMERELYEINNPGFDPMNNNVINQE